MKPIQYKFIIQADGESRVVTPAYKSDLSLEYELESGQQFFRKKLSGKLAFIRDDYDYLNGKDFNTEFVLLLQESKDGGKTWNEYYRGKFMKTDCTWDDDKKKCEVNPNVYDEYKAVVEMPHELKAQIDDHIYEAGCDTSSMMYLAIDGERVKINRRLI